MMTCAPSNGRTHFNPSPQSRSVMHVAPTRGFALAVAVAVGVADAVGAADADAVAVVDALGVGVCEGLCDGGGSFAHAKSGDAAR